MRAQSSLRLGSLFLFDFFLSELVHPVQCHKKFILICDCPSYGRVREESLKGKGCVAGPHCFAEKEKEGAPTPPSHSIERLGFPRDCKVHGQGSLICLLLLLLLFNSTPFCFRWSCLLSLSPPSFISLLSFSSLFTLHSSLFSPSSLSLASLPHSSLSSSLFTLPPSHLSASFIHSPHFLINERTHSSLNRPSFSFVWLNTLSHTHPTHRQFPSATTTATATPPSPPPHSYRSLSISSFPPYTPYF